MTYILWGKPGPIDHQSMEMTHSEPPGELSAHEIAMLIGSKPVSPGGVVDRRSSARHDYRRLRAAASWHDPNKFQPIYCQDLSTRGIGFFSSERPSSKVIVIRLSAENQKPVLVTARVVYCNDRSGNASFPFVVGCVFTKRLEHSD